jgi:SWI/SNF-related matrix-associated actin-dependent regulator of chromatin subfamily A3
VDRQKVLKAIAIRQVDPSDIPETAKFADSMKEDGLSKSISGEKKRKTTSEVTTSPPQPAAAPPTPAVALHTHPLRRTTKPQATEVIFIDDEPEEAKDELFCQMKTKIVGLQYYEGILIVVFIFNVLMSFFQGLVGSGEQVRLIRQPQNQYDR